MNRLFAAFLIVLMLSIGGCNYDTASTADALATKTTELNSIVDELRPVSKSLLEQLEAKGVVDSATVIKYMELSKEAEKVQGELTAVITAMDAVQPTGDNTVDTINTLRAANTATAPFNPYSPFIEIGLSLAAIIAGVAAIKRLIPTTSK